MAGIKNLDLTQIEKDKLTKIEHEFRDTRPETQVPTVNKGKSSQDIEEARQNEREKYEKMTREKAGQNIRSIRVRGKRCTMNPDRYCQTDACSNWIDNACIVLLERKKNLGISK